MAGQVDEIRQDRRSTVSLCMMLRRPPPDSFDTLGPFVDELCLSIIDGDEVARTRILRWVERRPHLAGKPCATFIVNPVFHPDLYRLDAPATYTRGQGLAGEEYRGPCSGRLLLANWAAARNMSFSSATQDWRLCLEPDELLLEPRRIASACLLLDRNHRNVGYVPRRRGGRLAHAEKLARGIPSIRWEGVAREALEGCLCPAVFDGFLSFAEWFGGPSIRPSDAEIFRILYVEAREKDWAVPPVNLLHMARTAKAAGMADFIAPAIDAYLENSFYPEERAWACAIRGEHLEESGRLDEAEKWYRRSMEEHPGSKTAYRLSRLHFSARRWQDCLDIYRLGLEYQETVQLVDDGLEDGASALIPVAIALHELGRKSEARETAVRLRALYPSSADVLKLCDAIEKG
jgi:tetratricopeptide (TPR) repeat protein